MPRVSYKARREFAKELLEYAFFGAFHLVIGARKKEESLTRAQLGSRMGREKTGISKLLSGPRNWQLGTISDLSEALGVRLEFSLVDMHFPERRFTASGIVYDIPPVYSFNNFPAINMSNTVIGQSGLNAVHIFTGDYQRPLGMLEVASNVGTITYTVNALPSGQTISGAPPRPAIPAPRPVAVPTPMSSILGNMVA